MHTSSIRRSVRSGGLPTDVLTKLGLIAGPLPAAFAAIAPLFLFGYHLTRKKHAQIISELEQRNSKKTEKAA